MNFVRDEHGDLTDDGLDAIKNFTGNYHELMGEIAFLFKRYGRCEFNGERWIIATGGWSGCEAVVRALEKNRMFWVTCWYCSKRGGYYEFICE